LGFHNRESDWEGGIIDRQCAMEMMRSTLMLSAAVGLLSCAAPARDAPAAPVAHLPLSIQGQPLSLRAELRELTAHSANLIIYLVASTSIAHVNVEVSSTNPLLHAHPSSCVLHELAPPAVVQSDGPPYALPPVPLCNIVLSASANAIYPLLIRVRDASGADLIKPIKTAVDIREGSS
jgi:hypothetical protein